MSEAKRNLEPQAEGMPPLSLEEDVTDSRSQDELVHEFIRLDSQIRELDGQRKDVQMALAGIAYEQRAGQNTVHVPSSDGKKVKVEFGVIYDYENEQMFTVAKLLGKEKFDDLFTTEVRFKAKARNLKVFMNTVPPEEKEKTAQQIITQATTAKPKSPYVSVEKS